MKDNKTHDFRRKLLKSIAAGSGAVIAGKTLPEQWKKPVVDSVLLPVHARTSGRIFTGTNVTVGYNSDRNSLVAKIAEGLLSNAHAGEIWVDYDYAGCAKEVEGGLEVWITYLVVPDLPELTELHGTIPLSGGELLELVTTCSGSGNSTTVQTGVELMNSSVLLTPQNYPEVTLQLDTSCVEKITFPSLLCPSN